MLTTENLVPAWHVPSSVVGVGGLTKAVGALGGQVIHKCARAQSSALLSRAVMLNSLAAGASPLAVSRTCSSSDANASSDPCLDIVQSRCDAQGAVKASPSRGMPLLGGDAMHISHRIQVHLRVIPVVVDACPCCALPCPHAVCVRGGERY